MKVSRNVSLRHVPFLTALLVALAFCVEGTSRAAFPGVAVNAASVVGVAGIGVGPVVCYDEGPCGPGCWRIPTSLRPLNMTVPGTDWLAPEDGGNCGIKRCFFFWLCPCGPPLAAGACPL